MGRMMSTKMRELIKKQVNLNSFLGSVAVVLMVFGLNRIHESYTLLVRIAEKEIMLENKMSSLEPRVILLEDRVGVTHH